jgi:GNAT superfamily N-acetyltransferase
MKPKEVEDIAVEWAAGEGWNPGLHDAGCFYRTDPNGFFVGLMDDEPISCISVVGYDSNFAFLGFYIVKPEYRGKGYGRDIWNAGMKYGENFENIGLDGVIEQQPFYKKSGYKLAYSNIRYEGKALPNNLDFPELKPLLEMPFDEVASYDSELFPADREEFMRCWTSMPESIGMAAVKDGRLAGYGILRKCRNGYKFGPLFADSSDLAEKLYLALAGRLEPGLPIYLDTPEINEEAVALAEKYNMEQVFGTARMYTGAQPDIDISRIFGVTTFELG